MLVVADDRGDSSDHEAEVDDRKDDVLPHWFVENTSGDINQTSVWKRF